MNSAQIPQIPWCEICYAGLEKKGDNNGRWPWMWTSTNGKHIIIIWNNCGHLLVLKTPRQWRIVAKFGGELRRSRAPFWKYWLPPHATYNRWESVITQGRHILAPRNLSSTVFLPCLLLFESLLYLPRVPLVHYELHFIPDINSWAMNVRSRNTKMTNTC